MGTHPCFSLHHPQKTLKENIQLVQSQAAQLEVRHTWGNPAPTLPVMGLTHSLGHTGAVNGAVNWITGAAPFSGSEMLRLRDRCCMGLGRCRDPALPIVLLTAPFVSGTDKLHVGQSQCNRGVPEKGDGEHNQECELTLPC